MSLTIGTRLGPYEIVAPLGAGGMGEVYRGRDTRLGRDVAIKVLPAALRESPQLSERFAREARTLSQLRHPNICTLHDLGHESGIDYLVMELIEGETLAARLTRGPLPIDELLRVARAMCGALAEAHRAGVVHRDLKPGNLMLAGSGVKLLDFGLARPVVPAFDPGSGSGAATVAQPLTMAGAIVGTFQYMAPEQLEGKEADERTDVFAMGCILHEMATGRRPFAGDDLVSRIGSMVRERPASATRLNEAVPRSLERIIERCLERDPVKRYPGAEALGEELDRLGRWAHDEGLPELARICDRILVLEEGRDSWSAFELAREIEKFLPGNAMLERMRPDFSLPVSITSDPPGATVSLAFYGDPEGEEMVLGTTPLNDCPLPRGLGRLRLELENHRPCLDIFWSLNRSLSNASDPDTSTWHRRLYRLDELPAGMEPVPPGGFPIYMPGLDHLEVEPTASFLMDRHPVTNREFKRFVDDRGYERAEFWREPFLDGEKELSRGEAMKLFVDSVEHPGPANWEMGEFPAGDDEHPVTGISWYEATAYAAWAGSALPTIFHWSRAAFTFCTAQIGPLANFAGRGTVPVGTTRSENRYGIHDLAGNVREWVVNPVDRPGQRFILGGGWNDPGYAFTDAYAQAAFDRSLSNGFRCIRPLEPEPNEAKLIRRIELPFRDFRAEQPVSDDVFAFFRRLFDYDRRPLEAKLIGDQMLPTGRWETVEVAAAYGGERMNLHLFLPARGEPPYQTVLLFPGSLALHTRTFTPAEIRRVDFIIKSGRALLLPIYQATYERGGAITSDYPEPTTKYRDHVVMWGKDVARAIDFVESRPDLDATRVAYFGASWGGGLGAILPAIEPRIRANILYVAGFCFQRALPEADQVNYITRVTQPTLMLNGELDFFFPAETSQRPMFEMLGAPAEQKKRLTYPRGHTVPKTELIKESNAWLDRWLGEIGC